MQADSEPSVSRDMLSKITPQEMSGVLQRALTRGLPEEEDTAIIFYDLSRLEGRVRDLRNLFPPSALHAVAVKANPLQTILSRLKELGTSAEAASLTPARQIRGAKGGRVAALCNRGAALFLRRYS